MCEQEMPREQACMQEIQALLDKYGCRLDYRVEKQGRVLILSVVVLRKDEQ